jgi:RNA polymerase-binding transcription factor DksA
MLTPEDIDHFKHLLDEQRDKLERRIQSLERAIASPDEYAEAMEDRGDDAVLLQERDNAWDQLAFARDELAQVKKALDRVAAGTYGISEVSGKPIPRKRLEALPTAATLVDETPRRT